MHKNLLLKDGLSLRFCLPIKTNQLTDRIHFSKSILLINKQKTMRAIRKGTLDSWYMIQE